MSGTGNIFSVIDNRQYQYSKEWYDKNIQLFVNIQGYSIEGIMVINESLKYEFEVWFFNPDGSSGMMCGNGGRCAVEFAQRHNFTNNSNFFSFKMANQIYNATFEGALISLYLPAPQSIEYNKKIINNSIWYNGDYINVGSDHFVINYFDSYFNNFDFYSDNIIKIASELRYNEKFERGANINYYKKNNNYYDIRTFERGVEKITGACGTGACSTALSIFNRNPMSNPMKLLAPSGEFLEVEIILDNKHNIVNFKLTGSAKKIDTLLINI